MVMLTMGCRAEDLSVRDLASVEPTTSLLTVTLDGTVMAPGRRFAMQNDVVQQTQASGSKARKIPAAAPCAPILPLSQRKNPY